MTDQIPDDAHARIYSFISLRIIGYVHEDWEKQVSGERKLVGYIDVTPDMPNRPPKVRLTT